MPPIKPIEICQTCKFARANTPTPVAEPNANLSCRIRAPIAYVGRAHDKEHLGIWPAVRPDGWCAEWKEKT